MTQTSIGGASAKVWPLALELTKRTYYTTSLIACKNKTGATPFIHNTRSRQAHNTLLPHTLSYKHKTYVFFTVQTHRKATAKRGVPPCGCLRTQGGTPLLVASYSDFLLDELVDAGVLVELVALVAPLRASVL